LKERIEDTEGVIRNRK